MANKFSVPLKPQKGKLYNLVSNRWVGAAAASIAANVAIWSYLLYQDNTATKCQDVAINIGNYNGRGISWVDALGSFSLDYQTKYPAGTSSFALGTKHTYLNVSTNTILVSDYDIVETAPTYTYVHPHAAGCLSYGNVTTSAFDTARDEQLNDVLWLDNNSPKFVEAVQKEVLKNPDTPLDGTQGLTLEEVQSQTYTDANGVVHHITKDPTTGVLLDNGVPMPDEMVVVDSNGVVHRYTIDPITGNILDNNNPIGNFAQWTDSQGVQHTITVDPQTGRLLDNGQPWNPNYTVSNPSNGSPSTPPIAVDPYTGNAVADLTPLININNQTLLEQKKTTDAILNTNTKLDDLNKVSTDIKKSSKLQENLLTDIYSTLQNQNNVNTSSFTETRPMTLQGVQTTAQNIISSSSIATWGDALRVAGPSGLPVFTIPTAFGDVSFDTSTYKFVFDALGYLTLIAAGYISILIVFRSK